jgi:hypothetical protein
MEIRMKVYLQALVLTMMFAAPAAAQMGNIHGAESRGEPFNASYRAAAVDPATGYTPGHNRGPTIIKVQKQSKKKKVVYQPR